MIILIRADAYEEITAAVIALWRKHPVLALRCQVATDTSPQERAAVLDAEPSFAQRCGCPPCLAYLAARDKWKL